MTKHIPYFDFYPADFMNGVRGLSAQEVGVYTMLLCRIYEESGPVEYHPARLSTYCGMRQATFEKTVDRLVVLGKFSLVDGRLSNRRAEVEIQSRSDKLKNSSKAGKASAQKRKENQCDASTDVQQPFNHTDTDKTTLSRVVTHATSPSDFDSLSQQLDQAGNGKIHPQSLLVVGPIVEMISSGVSLDLDILPTVKAVSSRLSRPVSLAYFTGPIREAYERRIGATANLPKPKPLDESETRWAQRLSFARSRKVWSTAELGPMPGAAGCRVPAALLIPEDGQGWTEIENRSAA